MKSDSPAKHVLLALVLALVFYAIFYSAIEHRRTRKGPWQVRFHANASGDPAIAIFQPSLAITNVQITFPDEPLPASNNIRLIIFDQPRQVPYEVPFGKCIFMDTTFLPGTVTFQLYGHEIELLPRVLMIDHQEHQWLPDGLITLHHAEATTLHEGK